MTSGYMNCPKCGKAFQYADYDNDGKWVEHPEPWRCGECGSPIITDKERGYGLTTSKEEQ